MHGARAQLQSRLNESEPREWEELARLAVVRACMDARIETKRFSSREDADRSDSRLLVTAVLQNQSHPSCVFNQHGAPNCVPRSRMGHCNALVVKRMNVFRRMGANCLLQDFRAS